jgi:hypothetical protein
MDVLNKDGVFTARRMAGAGSLMAGGAGMLAGGAIGAGLELDNIARARAAVIVAKSQNLGGTPEFAKLEKDLEAAEKNMSGAAKMLDRLGFGTGENYARQPDATGIAQTPQAIPTALPSPPSGSTRTSRSGVSYDTSRSTGSDGRVTETSRIVPGTSAAPTTSVRPVARPTTSSPSTTTASPQQRAQAAADRQGTTLATGGRATGGLVQKRKPKKKPVAKK